jgi:hypothetical protein
MKQLKLKLQLITPEYAIKLLALSEGNRTIKKSNLANLVKEIGRGAFDTYNGVTIKITESGVLVDGHHRLLAVIKSGVAVYMHIISGCTDESMQTIDSGAARSAGDVLKMSGLAYSNNIPPIIKFEDAMVNGYASKADASLNTSNQYILARALEQHHRYSDAAKFGSMAYQKSRFIQSGTFSKFYNIFSRISHDDCMEFFDGLISGLGIDEYSPIYHLRNAMIKNQSNTLRKLSSQDIDWLITLAWNKFLDGTECKVLRINKTHDSRPQIKGIEILEQKTILNK